MLTNGFKSGGKQLSSYCELLSCDDDLIKSQDYACWSRLKKRMGTLPSKNIDVMKSAANGAWDTLSREEIISMCDRFQERLTRVIAADGGPIEFT